MSGDYAQYGRELWRGLELAQAELKEQGDSIELILEDGATLVPQANVAAATKLINVNQADLIMVLGADDVGALTGLSRQSNTPILSLWDNSKDLLALGNLVFSSGFSIEKTAQKIARYSKTKLNLNSVAIIANNSNWSTSINNAFLAEFKKIGGTALLNKTVAENESDYRSLIPTIKTKNPDFIFLPLALPSSVEACIKQLRTGGLKMPIFTGEALIGEAIQHLGELSNGVYVTWLQAANPLLSDLYKKRYGDSSWDPAIVQVGYQGLFDLSKATKTDSTDLISSLLQYYGPTRAAQRELVLYQVNNSKVELARP